MPEKLSLDVVIPVYNEEKVLEESISRLNMFLRKNLMRYEWSIVIADNASTDRTQEIAGRIAGKYSRVSYIRLKKKGRGRALRKAWTQSRADFVAYMDVDLSTELNALPKLLDGMRAKGCHVATATRLTKKSRTKRSLFREVLSRGYNLVVKTILWVKYSDAQCGFKAATRKAVNDLVPLVKDNNWFFDTELLTLAEKKGYGIYELPVKWVEHGDSKVDIGKTVYEYIRDVMRLRIELWLGRVG